MRRLQKAVRYLWLGKCFVGTGSQFVRWLWCPRLGWELAARGPTGTYRLFVLSWGYWVWTAGWRL
jgi:hypothetical protein